MTTELDTKTAEAISRADSIQPITVFGGDLQIASLVRRVRKLIKGAEGAPDAIIWRACQLATSHHLDIFNGDIWLYPAYTGCKDDEWIVDVGVSAWRRAAQRQARYNAVFALLEPAEVAQRVGQDYTPEDVGVKCELYRLDVAREYKELGIPYSPTVAYGFWRKQARWLKKDSKWLPDQLAATETKEDKAKKRAEKKALRIAFTLDYPDEHMVDLDHAQWRMVANITASAATEEKIRALPANHQGAQIEANGDQLWA